MPFAAPRCCRGLFVLAAVGAGAPAQEPKRQEPAKPGPELVRIEAAVERWLASGQTDEKLLDAAVSAVVEGAAVGLPWLGERLEPARRTPADARSKGLMSLATRVALEFVREQAGCGMVFVGQYRPLQALQPFVGKLFFHLLLETPDWFPDDLRQTLVPALRDLLPKPPGESIVLGIEKMCADVELEPTALRQSLACLLWQWGRKDPAQRFLADLRRECAEGDAEDRVLAHRNLGDLLYRLREYREAAGTYAALVALAAKAAVELSPADLYTATCVEALLGDKERALQMFARCAQRNGSPDLDASLRLPRKLFLADPEIAGLRADTRFAALLAQACEREEQPPKAGDKGR
jgi:tetratricopeptide (TPR) repeat protein